MKKHRTVQRMEAGRFDRLIFAAVLALAAATAVAVFISRDALARVAWQDYNLSGAALFLDGGDAQLAMDIGNYYFSGGAYDLDRALGAYKKAVAIQGDILWGHYQIARIFFVKSDFGSALKEINAELAANPQNLRSLYVRGLIYGYGGMLDKAESDFKRFTEWSPTEWAGYNDLAWIQEKKGDYQSAKKTMLQALNRVPDAEANPWLWNSLGVAQMNLSEFAPARKSFSKAAKLADGLTAKGWRESYPGNNPAKADEGLSRFREAIAENLKRTGEFLW